MCIRDSVHTEDALDQLAAARAYQTADAEDLAAADGKADALYLVVRAGRSELVEGIFGMHELASGEIFVKGKQVKVQMCIRDRPMPDQRMNAATATPT